MQSMTQPHGEAPAGLNSKCEAGQRSTGTEGRRAAAGQLCLDVTVPSFPPGGRERSLHPPRGSFCQPSASTHRSQHRPETQVVPNISDELHANLSATQAGGSSSHRHTGWEPWTRSSPWETLADKQPVFSTCLNVWPGGICLGFQELPCAMSPEPAVGPGGGSGQTNSPGITAALSRQRRLWHGDLRTLSTLETLSSMPASGSDTPKHRGHPNSQPHSLATWSVAS
uniref:Uncharacterized protein n=1 Tax=Myotis myotis TaxID=51298 RepID=A0A7J7VYM8_MYOMY|nr:hypothetical protein mMyoMyo1_012244 [Myotis myotis]